MTRSPAEAALRRAEAALAAAAGRTHAGCVAACARDSLLWSWVHGPARQQPPGPPGPPGLLWLDRHEPAGLTGCAVSVVQADPVIWVSAPMLTWTALRLAAAELTVEPWSPPGRDPAPDLAGFARAGELGSKALFKVAADSWLVYRVGRYLPALDVYECSFPDLPDGCGPPGTVSTLSPHGTTDVRGGARTRRPGHPGRLQAGFREADRHPGGRQLG